jgi:hypothetical protein
VEDRRAIRRSQAKLAWPDRHAYLRQLSPDGAYYWCGGEYYLGEQVRLWEARTGREVIAVRGTICDFHPIAGRSIQPFAIPLLKSSAGSSRRERDCWC